MSYLSDLAAQFRAMANAIDERLNAPDASFDAATEAQLVKQRDRLRGLAGHMIGADIEQTLDAMKSDRDKLTACADQLETAIRHLATVAKVVGLAAAAVELAGAIVSRDLDSVGSVLEDAEKALHPPEDDQEEGDALSADVSRLAASGEEDS